MIAPETDQPSSRLRQASKKPVQLSGLHPRGRLRAVAIRRVRGRFDSAATTADNRRHWAKADGLSADSAASADVRRTLRNRRQGARVAKKAAKATTATKAAPERDTAQQGAPVAKESAKAMKTGLLDAAALVLQQADQPMNAKEMVDAVLAKGEWSTKGKTPAATLYASILREIQKKGDQARILRVVPIAASRIPSSPLVGRLDSTSGLCYHLLAGLPSPSRRCPP